MTYTDTPPALTSAPDAAAATPRRARRWGRALLVEWLPVTLFYTVVGCALTWPLAGRMTSGIYGFGNDNWGGIWFIKWIHSTFWSGRSSAISHQLEYPFGYVFDDRYIAPYDRVVAIVFGGISNGLFAYNLMILVSFPMAGVAMYVLAKYLTGSRSAALLGGLIFAASPFHLAMAMQYPAMACIFPIPLLVLGLVRTLGTRRLRDAAWAGAALALVWATSYYYGWFAIWFVLVTVIAAATVGLWHASRQRRVPSELREGARFAVTRGAVMGATFVVIAVPLLLNLITKVMNHSGVYTRPKTDLVYAAVRPWMYLLPPHDNPVFGWLTRSEIQPNLGTLPVYEQSVYLGAVAVALAGVALVLHRRAGHVFRAALLPLLAGAAFCLLLTLGPAIPIDVFSFAEWHNPGLHPHITGPDSLLYDLSQNFRYYGRAFVFVSVVLASLAAVGFTLASRPLISRFGRRSPQALLVLLMGGVLLEFSNLPPQHFIDLSTPPWLTAVKNLPANAAIMEYPDATYSSPRSLQYIYWQTRHGHPTVNPPDTPQSQHFMGSVDDPNSFLSGRTLSRAGVDFVIVHTKLASPTFPPYQPAWPSDQLPRSAGRHNPWFALYRTTPDAVIYRVRRTPTLVAGATIGYGGGWGPLEVDSSGHWRWLTEDSGKLPVFAAHAGRAVLELDMSSFSTPRTVDVTLRGKRIVRREASPTEITHLSVPLSLRKGYQVIDVSGVPGPVSIDAVVHNGDLRTVSIRAGQLRILLPKRQG